MKINRYFIVFAELAESVLHIFFPSETFHAGLTLFMCVFVRNISEHPIMKYMLILPELQTEREKL